MIKQKSGFFFPAVLCICLLSLVVATGCGDEKKSSTESTTTDTSTMSTQPSAIDTMTMHGDTNAMDTATTRPIVPGT